MWRGWALKGGMKAQIGPVLQVCYPAFVDEAGNAAVAPCLPHLADIFMIRMAQRQKVLHNFGSGKCHQVAHGHGRVTMPDQSSHRLPACPKR